MVHKARFQFFKKDLPSKPRSFDSDFLGRKKKVETEFSWMGGVSRVENHDYR